METKILTYKQYVENYIDNSKYKEKYLQNKKLMDWKKEDLKQDWVNYLIEKAKAEVFPHWVCQDFIRRFGEKMFFRVFRGVSAKGISEFRVPKLNK